MVKIDWCNEHILRSTLTKKGRNIFNRFEQSKQKLPILRPSSFKILQIVISHQILLIFQHFGAIQVYF